MNEALLSFDMLVLLLLGAVDATALVAHEILGLKTAPSEASWQKTAWLNKVSKVHAPLGALFAAGAEHTHTLMILRRLRNTIHGDATRPLQAPVPDRPDRWLVKLPDAHQADLAAAFTALGGSTAAWGVESALPWRTDADPVALVGQLLPRVLKLLDDVMATPPVEQIADVKLQASDLVPPAGPVSGLPSAFSEMNRQSVRWQLGL